MSLRKRVGAPGTWLWLFVPVFWAVACGDSPEDCEKTQTCIEPDGEGGEASGGDGGTNAGSPSSGGNGGRGGATGGGGATGATGATGGSSGSGSGASGGAAGDGSSGAAGAGAGGDAGGGGGDDAPTVVSVTLDGSEDTEDIDVWAELVIEFSEAIDADTLTNDSVQVTVGGHVIAGELAVDDATHATFTPLERYYLTAEHTLTVSTDVTDTAGTALEQDYELGFTVRDGAWTHAMSTPPAPLPNTFEQMKAAMGVDGAGNVLVVWADPPSSFYARWYRQGSGWEAVHTLSSTLSICPTNCVPVYAAVNRNGDAIAATASGSNISVYQYRDGAWGPVMALEVGETPPFYTGVGISDIGEAHVVSARQNSAPAGALISRRTTTTGTWRPVAESAAGEVPGYPPRLAFDANGNGIMVWPDVTVVRYSRYEQASGQWSTRATIPRSTAGQGVGAVSVALRPGGDGLVAWASFESSTVSVVKGANYTGAGFADVNPAEANPAGFVSYGPALTYDGAEFVAAWANFGGVDSNTAWSARLRNGTWTDVREISAGAGRYSAPSLGADASGNTMALVRMPTEQSWEETWWNRYRRTTGAWSAASTRLLAVKEYRDDPAPALVVAPNGTAAAAISYSINEKEFLFDTSVILFQ